MGCDGGTSGAVVKRLLPHFPRSISVRIPGGQGSGIIFEGIKHVFELCAEVVGTGVLALESLEFCLNTHTRDPAPWRISEALSLVKCVPLSLFLLGRGHSHDALEILFVSPRKFIWTGPDPPHHFSTAVRALSDSVPT